MKLHVVILVSLVLQVAQSAAAGRFYVDLGAGGDNDGSTWTHAYTDLQAGIDACEENDEVWVKAGTYVGNYTVRDNKAVYGGFLGFETSREQSDPVLYPTIIHGNGGVAITVPRDYGNSVIEGFNVTGGSGYAIDCYRSLAVTIRHCVFTNNSGGAAIRFEQTRGETSRVEFCSFENNATRGIYYFGRDSLPDAVPAPFPLVIDRCLFTSNSISGGDGGAVFVEQASSWVSIYNSVFWANRADNGGAIASTPCETNKAAMQVWNCTFLDNISASGKGHAVYLLGTFRDRFDSEWRNCIVWGTNWSQMHLEESNETNAYLRVGNSCLQNGMSSISVGPSANGIGFIDDLGGNIGADPVFYNQGEGYLALFRGSPCIDAGVSNGAPAELERDIEWSERPMGEGYDIGAYEFQSPVPRGTIIMLYGISRY